MVGIFIIMDIEEVENAINKLMLLIKPDEVTEVAFELPHSSPDSFTMNVVFVVPDEWIKSMDEYERPLALIHFVQHIRKQIKNYLGINIVIPKGDSRIVKESDWYRR
jgi:hypothetical protein